MWIVCVVQSRTVDTEGLQLMAVREECDRKLIEVREGHYKELQKLREELAALELKKKEAEDAATRRFAELQVRVCGRSELVGGMCA